MKKVLGCIASILLFTVTISAQYYYGNNQQIPLQIDSNYVLLKFDEGYDLYSEGNVIDSIDRIVMVYDRYYVPENFLLCSLSTGEQYQTFLDSISVLEGVYTVEPFYLDSLGEILLAGSDFCVYFKENINAATIDSLNTVYNVEEVREVNGYSNLYVLRNTDSTELSILNLANLYHTFDQTYYAHPLFQMNYEYFSYKVYDYYKEFQPHIEKIIGNFDTVNVWDFAGLLDDTIVVAVLDDGFETHEDLPASSFVDGYDFWESSLLTNPDGNNAHGMAVAGIIASKHTTSDINGVGDTTGIVSLNPNCLIKPIKIKGDTSSADNATIAEAIKFAWDSGVKADIISISWGKYGQYSETINMAFDSAVTYGRDNLGCPIFCASGNSGHKFPFLAFPAILDTAFSVGAIQLNDTIWDYSGNGTGLDICAPAGDKDLNGEQWSLDRMENLGMNPNLTLYDWFCDSTGNNVSYNCRVGGTSLATPEVAGIASLILDKDPGLSFEEVYEIIRKTAVKNLSSGVVPEIGNNHYGYGRADAFRAILSLSHGDIDNDGSYCEIDDLVYLIDWSNNNGPAPFPSPLLADVNCSGYVDIGDIVFLVEYMFNGGPAPEYPCFTFPD